MAIYAPIAFRLLSASASRAERIALVGLLGVSLFAVKILASPTGFVRFDELGTGAPPTRCWRPATCSRPTR